jgi:hypothetical protein
MYKQLFLVLFIAFISISLKGQEAPVENFGYKLNHNFDVALSTNGNQSALALSWVKFHSIFKKKQFKIGYGIRYTGQIGKNLNYVTAPAIITSKQTGPQVLFSKIYYENIDTFFVSSAQNNSINASINLQYTIKNKLDIGFNIDAIGFSFGKSIIGKYMSYRDRLDNIAINPTPVDQKAKPTTLNALLVSDNDIGSLNSELYARYWFKPNWGIKIGATFLFTEYTTDNKLRLDNNRWRNKSLMGMIGITYSPFR